MRRERNQYIFASELTKRHRSHRFRNAVLLLLPILIISLVVLNITVSRRVQLEELRLTVLNLPDDLEKVPFTVDHLCIVVPEDHPFAKRKTVSVPDLKDESLLMIGKDAYMYKLCCDLCREAGFEPNVRFTSHRAENLIDLVGRGMGAAMLMRKPAAMFITEKCRLVDVIPEVRSVISLVWLKGRRLPPHHRKFVELTKGSQC